MRFHIQIYFSEIKTKTRWDMIRTVTDAKVAFETAFQIITQDRKQQCNKYDELKVSIYYYTIYMIYAFIL